jgi:acyl dehydratase
VSTSETSGLVTTLAGLRDLAGTHAGFTAWRTMEQERVNQFAEATDDHQYIHVDVERARESPFGGTIAHGFLTLSLVAPIAGELVTVSDVTTGLNYGLDRVRFPAPLPVGAQWRGGAEVLEVSDIRAASR